MAVGGARPGAGRPKGGHNKATDSLKRAVAKRLARSRGEFPHEFLARVARGGLIDGHEPTMAERIAAATAAAPYFAPKLASIEHSGAGGGPLVIKIVKPGD